jgi:hypothetical protein
MSFRFNVNLEHYEGGIKRIARRVRDIGERSERAMTPVSIAMAEAVAAEIRSILSQGGSGELWNENNPNSGGWWDNYYENQSGAAGEPPVSQSGSLRDSVKVEPTSKGRANLNVGGSGGRRGIAHLLEFGGWRTVFGNRAAAHPFVGPALARKKKDLRNVAVEEYRRQVRI